VLDFSHLGSSVSLRSYSRLGASLSVLDYVHLGSSMSVRSSFSCHGSSMSLHGRIHFASAKNYIAHDTDGIKAYGNYAGALGIKNIGSSGSPNVIGVLHGTWYADFMMSTSDRSLKKNIRPLDQTLLERGPSSADILRGLRPVSYKYKGSGPDAKNTRFGFIADEMAISLPEIARTLPQHGEDKQGLVYQDLLAFLVATLQGLSKQMSVLMPQLTSVEERIAKRKRWKRARRKKASRSAGSTGASAPAGRRKGDGASVSV